MLKIQINLIGVQFSNSIKLNQLFDSYYGMFSSTSQRSQSEPYFCKISQLLPVQFYFIRFYQRNDEFTIKTKLRKNINVIVCLDPSLELPDSLLSPPYLSQMGKHLSFFNENCHLLLSSRYPNPFKTESIHFLSVCMFKNKVIFSFFEFGQNFLF